MSMHRYVVLDGMRGIAAILVAVLHARALLGPVSGLGLTYLAVDFFFCLSGFVLGATYRSRLAAGTIGPGEFMLRRAIRLYPMILAGVLLGAASLVPVGHFSRLAIWTLGTFLLLPVGLAYGVDAFPVNNPLYSLFFEMVGSFAFCWYHRHRGACLAVMAASGAALVAGNRAYGFIGGFGYADTAQFLLGFARLSYPFFVGVLIAERFPGKVPSVVPPWVPMVLLPGLLLLPGNWWLELADVLCLIPLVVALGAAARPSRIDPMLTRLGELSYPLYAIHLPIFMILRHLHLTPGPALMSLGLGTAAIAAWAMHRFYDVPVRARLSSALRQHPGARRTAAASR